MASTPALERRYTAEEYEALEDRTRFELVDGCLVERQMGVLSSFVAGTIIYFLKGWSLESGGSVFGPDLGIRIHPNAPAHTRLADASYVAAGRTLEFAAGYLRLPPDLVVEVVSTGDIAKDVMEKAAEWLRHGVRMVWVVYPTACEVHVYAAGEHPRIVTADDTMEAPAVLPGFSTPVASFFPPRES